MPVSLEAKGRKQISHPNNAEGWRSHLPSKGPRASGPASDPVPVLCNIGEMWGSGVGQGGWQRQRPNYD